MGSVSLDHAIECAAKLDINSITEEDLKGGIIKSLVSAVSELPPVDCPLVHRFSDGVYLRQITIPAGTCIVGKIHATKHFNIILSGECLVVQSDGKKIHINGAYTYESEAGIQKCVYAMTDVIWQTVHVTEKADIAEIESDIIAVDDEDLTLKLSKAGK